MEITIKAPKDLACEREQWTARYTVAGSDSVWLIRIESRSSIDVIVAKVSENTILGHQENFYVSSPNFGVSIPGISDLKEDFWITEQLMTRGMPVPDAVTVAQVLPNIAP